MNPPTRLRALLAMLVAGASLALTTSAALAETGTIAGTVFQDLNRNAVRDTGEPAWEGHQLYLFDAAGAYRATATSDASGRYAFAGLADGDYKVDYASPSWWAIRDTWVPTTTGSVRPSRAVRLAGAATVDFGWRTIVRSTDAAAPLSTYTGPSGLRVESFDDVVSAREVHDAVAQGLIGAEARFITVRFDLGPNSSTVAGWQGSPAPTAATAPSATTTTSPGSTAVTRAWATSTATPGACTTTPSCARRAPSPPTSRPGAWPATPGWTAPTSGVPGS